MYHKLGYSVYRRVLQYYSGHPDEDAFGSCIDSVNQKGNSEFQKPKPKITLKTFFSSFHRHAQGASQRRAQKINHTDSTSGSAGRPGMISKLTQFLETIMCPNDLLGKRKWISNCIASWARK